MKSPLAYIEALSVGDFPYNSKRARKPKGKTGIATKRATKKQKNDPQRAPLAVASQVHAGLLQYAPTTLAPTQSHDLLPTRTMDSEEGRRETRIRSLASFSHPRPAELGGSGQPVGATGGGRPPRRTSRPAPLVLPRVHADQGRRCTGAKIRACD